jgi:type IV secretion system protein VirB5
MTLYRRRFLALGAALLLSASPAVHAQFAVIDVASLAQLLQQAATLAQQLATLQSQLRQAQQEYQSITGNRGMQNLLAGVNRNYLPTDWASLMAVVNGQANAFPALAAGVQNNLNANALLTPAQIASFSPAERAQLLAERQTIALLQATVQQALTTASGRFASLQQLIGAIGVAQDAKGSLDLTARISAEQAMLANDQSKLEVLYQAAQAQQWLQQQQARERSLSDIGSLRALPAMGL